MVESCSGKVVYFDQLGELDFWEKTERMGKTVLNEAPTSKRALRPTYFNSAYGFDEFDHTQLVNMDVPISKTLENLRMAASRRMDDVMIRGFLGTNYVGEDGVTPVELPSSQSVAANYVESGSAASSNLTVAKLRAAMQIFQKNEAWNSEGSSNDQLVLACSSAQIMSLLREEEITSFDYNNIKALVNGEVDTFMGFKIIRTERLPKDKNGVRSCLSWVKSRAMFGLWKDFSAKLSVRDDMDETIQLRAKFACGATRLEEEGFVKILCDETK